MKLFTQILNHKGASPLHSSHTSGDHESPKKKFSTFRTTKSSKLRSA